MAKRKPHRVKLPRPGRKLRRKMRRKARLFKPAQGQWHNHLPWEMQYHLQLPFPRWSGLIW